MSGLDGAAVLVVGTGLIGTSVALALHGTADVLLRDDDAGHLDVAVQRGAGRRWDGRTRVDLAVVAVPPTATPAVLAGLAAGQVAPVLTHVASSQSQVAADVERLLGAAHGTVCGGHPLAGRELRGPVAASARLFLDRAWAVCPVPGTAAGSVSAVQDLARACGALPVVLSPQDHDKAVALVSHLPQLAASAVAARLTGAPSPAALSLAGPGLQDTTRIAASDPALWTAILTGNAARVAPLVRALADDLGAVADALASSSLGPVRDLLERGNRGRALVPLKATPDLAAVVVEVEDRPGQLAALLAAAADAGVNVEDVRVEHLPGRPRGLVELLVRARDAQPARAALAAAGWLVVADRAAH